MKTFTLILVALTVALSNVNARIGETMEQCKTRYPHLQVHSPESAGAFVGNFTVSMKFLDGKCAYISYFCQDNFTQAQADYLIGLNGKGTIAKWHKNLAIIRVQTPEYDAKQKAEAEKRKDPKQQPL